MEIDLILFDLGGVLVDWDGIQPLICLSGGALSNEDARKFWLESPWVRLFETGRCRADEFAKGVCKELTLEASPEEFLESFVSWDRGPKPGARELLARLTKSFIVACLSNNNELHWPRLRDQQEFGRLFDHAFVSHEIGLIKPDPDVFEFVLSRLSVPSERMLFFDDNPECVFAARNCGIRAFQAGGVDDVYRRLADLSLFYR